MSSQYMRSWLSHEKLVGSPWMPSVARWATTSRAWTSMTTNALRVARFMLVSSPLTRFTMSSRSEVLESATFCNVPFSVEDMASVTCAARGGAETEGRHEVRAPSSSLPASSSTSH